MQCPTPISYQSIIKWRKSLCFMLERIGFVLFSLKEFKVVF